MDEAKAAAVMTEAAAVLRDAGARFAYVYGSRAEGQHRPDSDIDIASYFGSGQPPNAFDILLPPYFDELPRITRAHREFAASVTGRQR